MRNVLALLSVFLAVPFVQADPLLDARAALALASSRRPSQAPPVQAPPVASCVCANGCVCTPRNDCGCALVATAAKWHTTASADQRALYIGEKLLGNYVFSVRQWYPWNGKDWDKPCDCPYVVPITPMQQVQYAPQQYQMFQPYMGGFGGGCASGSCR